jgi:hypothetical protein
VGTIPARVDRSRGSPLVTILVALAWMAACDVPLDGDSFTFSFSPAAASGYSRVSFRAERRGDRIDAAFALDGNETAVVLERL